MARKRREFLQSELTPLIDVAFLLLVFFMATSVFKKDELILGLTLPSADGKPTKELSEKDYIKIEVTENELSLNGKKLVIDDLKSGLQGFENKKTPVELKVDKEVEYQRVIDVLNLVKAEGLFNIDLVTQIKK